MLKRNITCIEDFLTCIRQDASDRPGIVWFRGQENADWQLMPSFMRSVSRISETTLLNRFRQSAAMLTDQKPSTFFDWMFLMQHYGVPTRLLDWSESPLVAMYFAIENWSKKPDVDASLWCLWPSLFNQNANIVDKIEGQYIPSFEDEELHGYTVQSLRQNTRIELYPIATIATRNSARIQAQMGTFTIHHNKRVAIEEIGNQEHIIKYTIPSGSRQNISAELRLLGMTRFSLFPELASVGTLVKDMME